MAGTRTSLHADQTTGSLLEEREKRAPSELTPNNSLPIGVDAMDPNDLPDKIDIGCADLEHEWLLRSGPRHPIIAQ